MHNQCFFYFLLVIILISKTLAIASTNLLAAPYPSKYCSKKLDFDISDQRVSKYARIHEFRDPKR